MAPPVHNQGGDGVYDPDMPPWARRIENDVREVKYLLMGNGNPKDGLVVKVDRLEQSELRRNAVAGIALTAGITALAGTVWAKLTGKA